MFEQIVLFLAGFTIVASVILSAAYLFFLPQMRKSAISKISCVLMLTVLSTLQWFHTQYFTVDLNALDSRSYLFVLLLSPPVFFFFARTVIFVQPAYAWHQVLHFFWPLLGFALPLAIIPVVAFILGSGYTLWFVNIIWGLKQQRTHFRFELFFFVLFAAMALLGLLTGLAIPYINEALYYVVFTLSIGLAMMAVMGALVIFPDLIGDIMMVASRAYANSKLAGVDIEEKQLALETQLAKEEVCQNENLNLNVLAELIDLSPHQLSELVNTQYGMGYSRFIREHRVKLAKHLLTEQPNTSILAISMMTGFKSQSSFYTAFKESTGLSPGNYRRKAAS